MSVFEAKYGGFCGDCEERIRPGDLVTYVGDDVVHAACADGSRAASAPKQEVCTECWLIKPCGCGEF